MTSFLYSNFGNSLPIPTLQIFQELLKVLYGSPLEHTILLASFFLQLGVRCWLAATRLRRHTAYLLTRYDLTTQNVVSQEIVS